MGDFVPQNALERELKRVRAGETSMHGFLGLFSESELVVPSGGEVMPDGSGFQPLLFDKEGVQMVACFTSPERIRDFASLAPHSLAVVGREFLLLIPTGYGLVVNPGQFVGFDVTPDGLRKIVAEFV